MSLIDRMDWHYNGDFPPDLPSECGGTHIGMYMAWSINNDLIANSQFEDNPELIEAVKKREMTGRDFIIKACDEKFSAEDLNEEGLAFARYYYADEEGMKQYIIDYDEALSNELESAYHVEDNWDNYDIINKIINARYIEWKALQ